jgi:diguanylate cyclase (GGDEF)-like protein
MVSFFSSGAPETLLAVDANPSLGTLVPYAACCLLTVAMIGVSGEVTWSEVGPALALQLIVGVVIAAAARGRIDLSGLLSSLAIIGFLLSVALLRDGTPVNSGYGPLVLLPLMWAATRGNTRDVALSVAGIAAVYLVPVIVIGGPNYPVSNVRSGLLLTVMAGAIGISIVHLVKRVRRLFAETRELARTDELTGLPNRRAWEDVLARELAAAHRSDQPLTIALIDLDAFKAFNDTHGHLAGDRLLRETVSSWERALRGTDVLARWGGDEFGLLLPDCTLEQAEIAIMRLRRTKPGVSFSAGLARWDGEATADELIAAADDALYVVKRGAALPQL